MLFASKIVSLLDNEILRSEEGFSRGRSGNINLKVLFLMNFII